jgi:hypothetical protein
LLEVVVALTLMSILALVLSGSLSFGNRVWEHTSRATRSSGDAISTYQFLEASFGHVAKSPPGSEEVQKNRDFIGTSQEVSFRTSGFAQVGIAGARLIRLRLVADRLQVSLPLADGETAEAQPSAGDFILLSAIRSLAITYRGYRADHRDTGWVSEWQEEDSMPVLVRLSFEKASDGNQVWFFRLPERDQ